MSIISKKIKKLMTIYNVLKQFTNNIDNDCFHRIFMGFFKAVCMQVYSNKQIHTYIFMYVVIYVCVQLLLKNNLEHFIDKHFVRVAMGDIAFISFICIYYLFLLLWYLPFVSPVILLTNIIFFSPYFFKTDAFTIF